MANLKSQISKIVATKLKTKSGETLAEQLHREVLRLYDCIQYYIDQYYLKYEPEVYNRTWYFQGSMYAENIVDIRVEENQIKLSIRFNKDMSWHRNLWNSHDSYVPFLMNNGWVAPKLEQMIGGSIYRFTRFDGIHFIERGIQDFNKTNSLGIRIDVTALYNGNNIY